MKLKEIKGENVVVHCKSRIEAETLIKHTESEQEYEACWLNYGENTCFRFLNGKIEGFTDVDYYRESGYEIIEFADLVLPELNAEEVLSICHEICKGKDCDDCVLQENCYLEKESNLEKVVEICAQWKAEHEKKEPEVETVDICRIIEVMPDGRKRCVHEEDIIPDPELPYGSERIAVEEILKRFCMEHGGKYIAVHEVVCRVKE